MRNLVPIHPSNMTTNELIRAVLDPREEHRRWERRAKALEERLRRIYVIASGTPEDDAQA